MSNRVVRHFSALLLLLGFLFVWEQPRVYAATGILKQINFQGKVVTKTTGTNIADGDYSFTFTIYDASSAGTNLWTETKTITVTNGIFQTLLGSVTTMPSSIDFNTDNLYLGINFNSDGEMSPRVRLAAVPQAFNAQKVAGLTVTDTTGTLTIPSGKTISFADAFTTSGANALTLTTTASTNVTLPTTGTLSTLAGSETLTNKTIGSTGLLFENSESISNGTDGTISLGRNDAGTVTLLAKDNDANADLSVKSGGTGALTLDSTSTGTVGLGTSNNAKIINIGTGTAGNTFNFGTDNTTKDTINIGSALDDVAITGDQWSVTNAGVLTVVSCTGCGGGASTLQGAYDGTSGNTILTTTGRNIAFTLGEVASPTSFTLENQDTVGTTAFGLSNSIASGTLTNGVLIDQTGAGTMTNAIKIIESAGTITDGILVSGTLGNILNTDSIDITGAGAITGATGVTTTTVTASSTVDLNGDVQIADTNVAFDGASTILTATGAFTLTPGGAFVLGATGQTATVQGSTVSVTSTGAGNDITLTPADDVLLNPGDDEVVTLSATGNVLYDGATTDNTTNSTTTGVFGLVVDASISGASSTNLGFYIDYQAIDDSDATDSFVASRIDFTNSSGDAGDATVALSLNNANDASGAATDALLSLENNDANTAVISGIGFYAGGANAPDFTTGVDFSGGASFTNEILLSNGQVINGTDNNDVNITENGITLNFDFGEDTASAVTMQSTSAFNFGSTANGTSALAFGATQGGVQIVATGASAGEDISISATGSSVNLTSTESVTDAIVLTTSTNGAGVQIVSDGLILSGASTGSNVDITFDLDGSNPSLSSTSSVRIGIADFLNVQVSGTTSAASGDIWYDSAANKFKINENGTTKTLCNTTDAGCGAGGSTTLQSAYDADADGSDAIILTTSTDGSIIFQTVTGTQFQVAASAAPTVDLVAFTNAGQGTVTDGVDGLEVTFVQADDADATDTNAGLRLSLTSSSGDADTLVGLDITNITGGSATEKAIRIGSGYDHDLEFVDSTPIIRIASGAQLSFQDDAGNDLFSGFKEYFSSANYGTFEANGFVNIDGGFYVDNFSLGQTALTADGTSRTNRLGDHGNWVFDEGGTGGGATATNSTTYGCTVTQNGGAGAGTNTSFGMMEVSPDTSTHTHTAADATCVLHLGVGTGTNTSGILNAANKYIQYFKVKPTANFTQAPSARQMFVGAHNYTIAWGQNWGSINATHGFIGFANLVSTTTATDAQGGTQWNGFARVGNAISSATCGTGGNISTATNAFALMRIEARATNDVHFFIDNDVSNGISLTECGSGITSNISTRNLNPAINVVQQQNLSGATNQWRMFVDLYSHVIDDPRPDAGQAPLRAESTLPPLPPALDPVAGADLAEYYQFESGYESINAGDIVVLGDEVGKARPATRSYDRRLLGVISVSPGLTIGQMEGANMAPVALTGRVLTRVSVANGKIAIGDPITSSSEPGVGIKATSPGRIIGTAMESYSGSEEKQIMVFINPGYYLGDEGDHALLIQRDQALLSELESTSSASISGQVALLNTATQSSVLSQLITFAGGTRIQNILESVGEAIFRGPARFLARTVFSGSVKFDQPIMQADNSAGKAIITAGSRFVDVVFDPEYETDPIVNASLSIPRVTAENFSDFVTSGKCASTDTPSSCQDLLASSILSLDTKFAIVSTSKQGFMILLSKPVDQDLVFSWSAVQVSVPKVSQSTAKEVKPSPQTSATPATISPAGSSPPPTPTISPSPDDRVQSFGSPSASISPATESGTEDSLGSAP